MDPLLEILKRLNEGGVPFVVVGGIAAIAHGSPLVTQDVDVCAPLDHDCPVLTLEALIAAKRAAGRDKDRLALLYLERLLAMRPDDQGSVG